jgi:hypothetical protein
MYGTYGLHTTRKRFMPIFIMYGLGFGGRFKLGRFNFEDGESPSVNILFLTGIKPAPQPSLTENLTLYQ